MDTMKLSEYKNLPIVEGNNIELGKKYISEIENTNKNVGDVGIYFVAREDETLTLVAKICKLI